MAEYRPSKEMLNDLGCYLSEEYFSIRRRPEQHKLAVALYSGASAMGCEASCVSIVSMLANSPTPASAYKAPLFKPTMSFFRDIVNKGENPYALTIEGLFLLKEKKPNATIRVLERAIQLGGPDFPWKASCWHDIGGAYVAIGDHCKAEEYYEMAASAGSRDAWHQLAHTADKTPEEQRDALYKSGCLGERVAFRNLSVAFVIASKADGVTSEQKLDYFRFNEEADRLSGQSADKWY